MLMCQSSTSTATSWMMSLVFTKRDYRGLPLGAEGNLGSFQILSEPLTYNVAEFHALTCPPLPTPWVQCGSVGGYLLHGQWPSCSTAEESQETPPGAVPAL